MRDVNKLDREVAAIVFGHTDFINAEPPPYSSSVEHSFQVVEKMRERGWKVLISFDDGYVGVGMVHKDEAGPHWWENVRVYEQMLYAPEAISRAALAALSPSKTKEGGR